MPVLTSAINPGSDDFAANTAQMKAQTEVVRALAAQVAEGSGLPTPKQGEPQEQKLPGR